MAPRRCNNYVIIFAILLVVDSLLFAALAELTFGPGDPGINEVIFEGENVTLICRVTDVATGEIMTFNVTRGETNIIINKLDVSDGAISQFETMDDEIRFVLPAVKVGNTIPYKCAVTSNNQITQMKFYDLTVSPSNTTQCRHNSTYEKLSTDTLKLSCYYLSSFHSDNLVWIKTNSNGILSQLTSDLIAVSNNKRLLVTDVQPLEELSLSSYSCQTSVNLNPRLLEPSQGCNVGSFVVYSQPLVTFSPSRRSVSAGESRNVTCKDVSIQGTPTAAIWPVQTQVTNVSFQTFGSNILSITVSDSVKDGTLIDVTCIAFVSNGQISYTFTLTVGDSIVTSTLPSINMQTGSEGPGTNETPNQPLSTLLLVIIAGTSVALILAVVLSVVLCYCMCRKGEDVENEQQDFTVHDGTVVKRGQRSDDGTQHRNSTRSSEYRKRVTYDNNRIVFMPESLTNDYDNNTDNDNNLNRSQSVYKYDIVNRSLNHDVDEKRDDDEENPYGDDE
ncbi:hypothetical protein BSL78_00613 [Apostichopus japonicus]|uniref:Ig-like domain-containing protein n=1 Tax=Stichopus japonicus TaxID=307972 RepID=A0A2G8LQ75_STIJA|nr:hypothetical protein BSL78_00613 [Apostichopus japonicus]